MSATANTVSAPRFKEAVSSPKLRNSSEGNAVDFAKSVLARADAVCFDVDSTVVSEEGINVLADFMGVGEQVAAWTANAMGGGVKFEDALEARLNLIRPSVNSVKDCQTVHPMQLNPGVADFITMLHAKGVSVFLVSGGFRCMIEPVAFDLGIPVENVVANRILFNAEGSYDGFDRTEPTSRDMGKRRALETIKARGDFETMVMIGDGATDAQAKPPAATFIGYGGTIVREKVKTLADWFVYDMQDLMDVVEDSRRQSKL